ncbi:MAG: LysM peptidoglycan-binding domain-containing protein [bacterium]|nr:LysM peptidoglycan-binding domain-containing protein [bacterium]
MKKQAMIASLLALALLAAPLGNLGGSTQVNAEEEAGSELLSVSGNTQEKVQLDAPTNLRWGNGVHPYSKYKMHWSGVNDSTYMSHFRYLYSDWRYEVSRDGQIVKEDGYLGESFYELQWDSDLQLVVETDIPVTERDYDFYNEIFESGSYRFRVKAVAAYDDKTRQDSEWSEWSDSIVYVRPEQELGSVEAYWDQQQAGLGHFAPLEDTQYLSYYWVSLYKDGEPYVRMSVSSYESEGKTVVDVDFSNAISVYGEGKYYFTVQALSNDIDVVAHGKESPASDILDTSINAEKLRDILDSAEGKTSTEKVELLRDSADISSIQQAMQTDDAFRGQIQALESQYAAEQNITALPPAISDAVKNSGVNPDKVSVVGAAFNAAQGKEINLQMDMTPPENRIPVYSRYRKNVQLDIRLVSDNAEIHELAMPVSVTMPIPEGINADQLLILHYRADGSTEKTAFHVNGDGTVTFTVKSFSTFVFAEEGSADAPDDPEPSPAPGEDKPAPGGNNPAPASSLALDSQIAAAAPNSTVKVTREQNINTLSRDIMQLLVKRGDVTLDMEYEYDGTDYHIIIPAGKAVDNDIPWYGPLYLSAYFSAGDAADGYTYTVQKGDTLGRIARSHHTTVARLSAANPQIKNVDRIVSGQIINIQ